MATSKVFIYKKENGFAQVEFGSYQSNFNMCLTIDETKDSAKVLVLTRNADILKPNTIVRLGVLKKILDKDTKARAIIFTNIPLNYKVLLKS